MSATVFYDNETEKYWLVDNWTEGSTGKPLGIGSPSKRLIMHAAHKVREDGQLTWNLIQGLSYVPAWIARILT